MLIKLKIIFSIPAFFPKDSNFLQKPLSVNFEKIKYLLDFFSSVNPGHLHLHIFFKNVARLYQTI